MIRFACPGCAAGFTVADEKAGKSGKCPKCNSQFIIPDAPSADEPPPADGPPDSALETVEAPLPPEPPPLPPMPPPPAADSPPPPLPVEIQPCPKCGTRMAVMPSDLGLDIECTNCQAVFPARRADAPPPPDSGRRSSSGALVKLGSGSRRDDDDDDDRPSRRRSRRRDGDDDRPSRRRSRYEDDDDRPSRRRRSRRDDDDDDYGPPRKPDSIQTLGILLLIGGILAIMGSLGAAAGSTGVCCLWPGTYYELVYGIMAIIKGSQMMGGNDPPEPPRGLFVMAIITIINLDVANMVLGIVGLSMLNSPDVQSYYNRR